VGRSSAHLRSIELQCNEGRRHYTPMVMYSGLTLNWMGAKTWS
jgi:hypothetical protein